MNYTEEMRYMQKDYSFRSTYIHEDYL